MGFADALSNAGVRYLAASPETMLAPGVPSDVAHVIASNENNPKAMAKGVVNDVMRTKYDAGEFGGFGPAAAFDVLDLDPAKMRLAEAAIKRLNDDVATEASDPACARHRASGCALDRKGWCAFPRLRKDMPWRADRPAIAFYGTLASDGRLDRAPSQRGRAAACRRSRFGAWRTAKSAQFGPFGGADYSDAAGPTVHLPTSRKQIDPWASAGVVETRTTFTTMWTKPQ